MLRASLVFVTVPLVWLAIRRILRASIHRR